MTVADAAEVGVRIQQVDTYVVGTQSFRTDIQVLNGGSADLSGILYRYGDCYLQNADTGYGRVDNGAPACIVDPALGQRIEQWTPDTPGSHYFEGQYGEGYSLIGQRSPIPRHVRLHGPPRQRRWALLAGLRGTRADGHLLA